MSGNQSKGLWFSLSIGRLEVSIEGQFFYFLASPEGNLRVLYFGPVRKTGGSRPATQCPIIWGVQVEAMGESVTDSC